MSENKKIKIGGAPSKYRNSYCQRMVDWFLDFVDQEKKGMPQFEVFAIEELKVTPQTLINWRNDKPEFKEAYEICKAIQKSYVINRGLSGANNPRMTQFVLSTCFKMSEYAKKKPEEQKEEVGLSAGDRELLEKIAERMASGNAGGRASFEEGVTFGEHPYEDEDDE